MLPADKASAVKRFQSGGPQDRSRGRLSQSTPPVSHIILQLGVLVRHVLVGVSNPELLQVPENARLFLRCDGLKEITGFAISVGNTRELVLKNRLKQLLVHCTIQGGSEGCQGPTRTILESQTILDFSTSSNCFGISRKANETNQVVRSTALKAANFIGNGRIASHRCKAKYACWLRFQPCFRCARLRRGRPPYRSCLPSR